MIQTTHARLKIEMKESSYPRHIKNITKKIYDLYDKLDMTKILKQKEEMLQYHPKGFMKKFVKDNYEHLQKRVEEIKSDKEYNDAFYPGQYYEIHSLLYSKLGKN